MLTILINKVFVPQLRHPFDEEAATQPGAWYFHQTAGRGA